MFSKKVLEILDIDDPEVVFDFFVFFSRMEYALKRSGFSHTDKYNKEVKADWKSFKNHVNKYFDATKNKKLESATNYLVNNPPKKLYKTSDGIAFKIS